MHCSSRAVSGSSGANTRWCALVVAAALLPGLPLRAQPLPIEDRAPESDTPAPIAAPPASRSAATPRESWWQANSTVLVAGAVCTGTGLALGVGFLLSGGFPLLLIADLIALLAPAVVGVGALVDSLRTGREWPAPVGAGAGLIALAALVGVFVYLEFHPLVYPTNGPGAREMLHGMVLAPLSLAVAPIAVGGVLLADLLFRPKSDVSTSARVTASQE